MNTDNRLNMAFLHYRKQRVSITNASCSCTVWSKGNTILRNVGKYSSQDKASPKTRIFSDYYRLPKDEFSWNSYLGSLL